MRQIIFVVTLLLAAPQARAAIRPYLYEVRKGEAVSYVFGTLHYGVPMNDVRDYVENRMRSSRKVYFEIVNDREVERHWQEDPVSAFLQSPELNSKGRSLSARDRERLIRQYGFDPRIAAALRDDCDQFLTALTLRQPSLDSELQLAAMDAGIPVLPLEDDEIRARAEQIDPPERCRIKEMLRYSRRKWSSLDDEMVRAYRAGPERLVTSRELRYRNAYWLLTLVPEMSTGGVFVAVGVDHLFEKQEGLLRRLREAGFGVTRVL